MNDRLFVAVIGERNAGQVDDLEYSLRPQDRQHWKEASASLCLLRQDRSMFALLTDQTKKK